MTVPIHIETKTGHFVGKGIRKHLKTNMDPSEKTTTLSLSGSAEENYFVTYTFTDRSHSSRVAHSIMKLCMEDELFADVTILVDGKEFQLHRLVLSAQSCFFRSMFTSNLKEGRNRVIELRDVSENVFQLLVDYIYHGAVKLRLEELQEMYEVADMYQLTALFEECSRFLVRTVQVKNCLQIMWLADQHSDTSLYTSAKHCAKTHLSQLHDSEDFLNLPLRLLKDIIADGVPCSQNPTVAIKNWINFNKEEREEFSEILGSSLKLIAEMSSGKQRPTSPEDQDKIEELQRRRAQYQQERNSRPLPMDPADTHIFDPIIKPSQTSSAGSGSETSNSAVNSRAGTNDWCQCGRCVIMPTELESKCCKDIIKVQPLMTPGVDCICQHHYFDRLKDRQYLIEMHRYRASDRRTCERRVSDLQERDYRKIAYRAFTLWVHGHLGKVNRRPIPSCVVSTIKQQFPAPDPIFRGYYRVEFDGPAAEMFFD